MDILDLIIYIAIAFSGTVFGSFFTLAVHRIPKHQDITHERSYCPKCNHKLQFLDLIPVFSYIFLGGKCRYCKEKIRPRYLILELCSGTVFLFLALQHGISFKTFLFNDYSWRSLVFFAINVLFICAMFIIAGIDKEYKKIPNGLIIYALIICIFKILFESFLQFKFNGYFKYYNIIYSQLLGAVFPLIILFIELLYYKVTKKDNFPFGIGDLKYLAILGLYFGWEMLIIGIIIAEVFIFISLIYHIFDGLVKHKKHVFKEILEKYEIPLGFYLGIAFTILLLVVPYR